MSELPDLTSPRAILLADSHVVVAVEVTAENADAMSQEFGGALIQEEDTENGTYETLGLRLPSLYGAIEARIGEVVIKNSRGRLSTMDKQQFRQSFMHEVADHQNERPYSDEAVIQNTNPEIQSEEDLQAVNSRNLFEERQRRLRAGN